MPCHFVISDIQWASADDLRCPIHGATGSTCASRTLSGARSSVRSQPSIPLPNADPPFPKPSVTWWSLIQAPCSGLRSRGRRCATQRVVSQTGSAGAWLELFVLPHLADASNVHDARHHQNPLAAAGTANGNRSTKPGQVHSPQARCSNEGSRDTRLARNEELRVGGWQVRQDLRQPASQGARAMS